MAIYIAGKIKSNIRELEGSLIRLIAYASLTGREISLPLAQEVLRNVLQHDERAVTIEGIQKFVSDYYQLKHGELKSRNNSKSIAMPRQIAMYLCKIADERVAAGDREELRRQASFDRHPFDPEDRRPATDATEISTHLSTPSWSHFDSNSSNPGAFPQLPRISRCG